MERKCAVCGITTDLELDHIIPLQLGGTNAIDNLQLIDKDIHAEYTAVGNYLGKLLREGNIEQKEAQQLIVDFRDGKITKEKIYAK